MAVTGGIMVPHPPLAVHEVGRGSEEIIEKTINAYKEAARFVKEMAPETIVISSPHSVMYSDYLHISPGKSAEGDFSRFGAPEVSIEREYDKDFSMLLNGLCLRENLPAGYMGEQDARLDHGTLVPLYFILQEYTDFKLVRMGISGISLKEHYKLGLLVKETARRLDRKVLYVGSGDLSHKLQEDGPYGFDPSGPVYDDMIMDVMGSADFGRLADFGHDLCENAAECGHRSFVIMAGALDGYELETRKLCHEDVTGVGYGICTYRVTGDDDSRHFLQCFEEPEAVAEPTSEQAAEQTVEPAAEQASGDPYVALAKSTVEQYVKDGIKPEVPDDIPDELLFNRAGVFVSLHIGGELRGCIGTIAPVRSCIAEEIIENAISASTEDPRFYPVTEEELPDIEYSVDVLGEYEDIGSPSDLDVKRYGVIVSKGGRRGLLLPDLEGVDTVEQQIAIAKRKAGIPDNETDIRLQRFEVVRHI